MIVNFLKGKCLACIFLPELHTLVVSGDSYLYLWRFELFILLYNSYFIMYHYYHYYDNFQI